MSEEDPACAVCGHKMSEHSSDGCRCGCCQAPMNTRSEA